MEWFVRAFIRSAVVWLALGATLGLAMALEPSLLGWRTAHLHMNLLGFVSMMIFGVGYHVFPRLAGLPLFSPRLAAAHWWLANAGLALLAAGFAARASFPALPVRALLGTGGALSLAGAYAFAVNVWYTTGAGSTRRPAARGVPLPIAPH